MAHRPGPPIAMKGEMTMKTEPIPTHPPLFARRQVEIEALGQDFTSDQFTVCLRLAR